MVSQHDRRILHIWSPAFTNREGGIQEFSRFLTRAVQESFPGYNIEVFEYSVFSTNETRIHAVGRKLQSLFFSIEVLLKTFFKPPKLIISTHVHFASLACFMRYLFKIPSIMVLHGVEAWDPYPPAKARRLQEIERYLAVSRYTRDRFIAASGVSLEKIGILPNTFDENLFVPQGRSDILSRRFGLSGDKRVLLTVARLAITEKYKGYDQVITLLPALRKVIPNLHYLIVGRGTDSERICELVRKLGVEDAVTLTGFVSRDLLPSLYNACDAYVMPSTGEGFGIAFLEALGCGKPCVGGSTDGSRDPLMDGGLGVLVNPHDLAELEKAILATLEGKEILGKETMEIERSRMVRREFGYDRFKNRIAEEISAFLSPS